jgi:hypothetical protein
MPQKPMFDNSRTVSIQLLKIAANVVASNKSYIHSLYSNVKKAHLTKIGQRFIQGPTL